MLKRIKPETYTLLGILVLFAVGSLFHFLYSSYLSFLTNQLI